MVARNAGPGAPQYARGNAAAQKLSTMKLVGQEQQIGASTSSSTSLQQLRVRTHEERNVQTEQPQTLGSRLDMALHMLLHGKRLQDMLFASHTIEVCTRYCVSAAASAFSSRFRQRFLQPFVA